MIPFTLHPNVYSTDSNIKGLINMLETIWVRNHKHGDGTFFIVSGFANYNGGVRFYDLFKHHIDKGGKVVAIFGGSTAQKLSSQQVVEEMLNVGAEVHIVNRKRLLHAKCYGISSSLGQSLIVTSGNFTGPGMSQNAEASILLNNEYVSKTGFNWNDLIDNIFKQNWDFYRPDLTNKSHPSWKLLYDEIAGEIKLDETQSVTMIISLGHADTVRIQADKGSKEGLGTQYFWLSKDSYDFFPPLTIKNRRGRKATYSAIINMNYIDLNYIDNDCRVTFEAENNLDFRLGTGKLRNTKIANNGDIAAISRVSENDYVLKIFPKDSIKYNKLSQYAINYIGHQGKKYGYLSNAEYENLLNIKLNSIVVRGSADLQ